MKLGQKNERGRGTKRIIFGNKQRKSWEIRCDLLIEREVLVKLIIR